VSLIQGDGRDRCRSILQTGTSGNRFSGLTPDHSSSEDSAGNPLYHAGGEENERMLRLCLELAFDFTGSHDVYERMLAKGGVWLRDFGGFQS